MLTTRPDFLRKVLFADAATCTACGLFMFVLANPFGQLTRIPPALLLYAGLSLLPIAAFIALIGARAARSVAAVSFVIAGNLGWSAASFWVMTSGVIAPTTLGTLFLGAQAATVLALTVLELRGVMRLARGAIA
jgi:hypothetical protein